MFAPLTSNLEESRYGGKAAHLSQALAAGLPVPPGFALPWDAPSTDLDPRALTSILAALDGHVAVRSSAVGEDSDGASFAGQHATHLGVRDVASLAKAIEDVVASGRTEAAFAYRAKLGREGPPRMGVVVQALVEADVAGVLFTRDPLSGEDVRVIEATWGLGEAVVAGLVTPDRFVVERGGRVRLAEAGEKDLAIRWTFGGGTEEVEVEPELVHALCLGAVELAALDALASRCEAAFRGAHDLEFAFRGGTLHLLQRRAITRHGG